MKPYYKGDIDIMDLTQQQTTLRSSNHSKDLYSTCMTTILLNFLEMHVTLCTIHGCINLNVGNKRSKHE